MQRISSCVSELFDREASCFPTLFLVNQIANSSNSLSMHLHKATYKIDAIISCIVISSIINLFVYIKANNGMLNQEADVNIHGED